jgi:hypothetical protein
MGPLVLFASTVAASRPVAAGACRDLRPLHRGLFPIITRTLATLGAGRESGVELVNASSRPRPAARHRRAGSRADRRRTATDDDIMNATDHDGWRIPPLATLLAAVLLIACAEIGGASMVKFKLELTRWARAVIQARPTVHGLVGVRDVDEAVIDEALVKFDAALRLFHLHAEGMGLVIIATTMTTATLVHSVPSRHAIIALFTVGGAGYPLGYLLWGVLIPHYGIETGKAMAEWLAWIPFGGATIVAAWWLTALLAMRLVRRA